LSWLSRINKLLANLELPKARAHALSFAQQGKMTMKQRERSLVRGDSTTWGSKSLGPRDINWTSLRGEDQATILPLLQSTSNWIVLALGKSKVGTIPLPIEDFVTAMITKGKAFRKWQWWLTGNDELAAYDRKVEVWISSKHNIPKNLLDDLESLLNSSSAKDVLQNGTEGVKGIWEGTEAGLFPGLMYATDGSQEKGNMGAGFHRHEGETGAFCKVGTDEEGSSSNRVQHAAACIALEDAWQYAGSQRPLILLTDSKCLSIAIQKWIGEGIDPTIKESPDGDILWEILELLRVRIDLGLFTLFVKIKSHRGDFFSEMADRWADKGRRTEMEAT